VLATFDNEGMICDFEGDVCLLWISSWCDGFCGRGEDWLLMLNETLVM